MSKTGITLLAMLCLIQMSYAQSASTSQFKYDLKKINSFISNNWENEITKNKELPYPYITAFAKDPCMFYWDTYFINKGLIANHQLKLAKQNTLNLLSVVDRYGLMGNAAITTWGMNRSQPPYLSEMVRDIYKADRNIELIKYAYPILKKEYHFWTDTTLNAIENHRTAVPGLQRYYHHATKKELIALYNEIADRVKLNKDASDDEKSLIATNYAAEAETGMDFTSRFDQHCSQFIAVDLNCLLYGLEKNLEWMSTLLRLTNEPHWAELATNRKTLINRYCWDEQSGLYCDYNFVTHKKGRFVSVAAFQALWAGVASTRQAKKLLAGMKVFKTPYGLKTINKEQAGERYQWGARSIWAPMQLIAVDGMRKYGFKVDANNLALKFMNLIAKNYELPKSSKLESPIKRSPGMIYEKYKADGTINDDEADARNMMGWTAGVYAYLYQTLKNPND